MTSRASVAGLGLLALLAFLPGLGARDLWNPDEPRYAEVAREMVASGQYLVPHLAGSVYAEKPPLFFWSVAFAGRATGTLDEVAVRLPSVVAAVGTTVVVYLIAALYFERRAAFFSALVYLSGVKVLWQGRVGQIDMLLAFWVALSIYLWVRRRERNGLAWGFWMVAGLATLTKGPVGLLPPLFVVLAASLLDRDREARSRQRIGGGLLIWLGIVLLWLVPALWAGGASYFEEIVLEQNLNRYVSPWGHLQPWNYYATVLPVDFFPWVVLLPGALLAGRRSFFGSERKGFRLAWLWVVVTVLFFSLSPGKRSVYIFQMYPGLAILVGAGLEAWYRERRVGAAWFSVPMGVVGIAGVAAAGLAPSPLAERPEAAWLPGLASAVPWVLGCLGGLLLVVAWWLARRRVVAVPALALGMITMAVVASVWLLPPIDRIKSGRPIGGLLAEFVSEEPVGTFPSVEAGILFYAQRIADPLCSEVELRRFATQPSAWLIANLEQLDRVRPRLALEAVYRDERPDGWGLFRPGDQPWSLEDQGRVRGVVFGAEAQEAVEYGYPCGHR